MVFSQWKTYSELISIRPDLICSCGIRDAQVLSRRSWKGSEAGQGVCPSSSVEASRKHGVQVVVVPLSLLGSGSPSSDGGMC